MDEQKLKDYLQDKGFSLERRIGSGGFGIVYLAHQHHLSRNVAVKVILPENANKPDFIRRFDEEARLIATIENPHIVPIFDYWRSPEFGAFIIMRWVGGGSLLDSLKDNGAWDIRQAARLLSALASALNAAHVKNVVHQDIKPANVMMDAQREIYLGDFGIAKTPEFNLAMDEITDILHGSPAYISPEHLQRGEITPRSDIYSLGLLMYEVLTGRQPYAGAKLMELLNHQVHTPLPPLQEQRPELPTTFNEVLLKATQKLPEYRYVSTLEMADDFQRALERMEAGITEPGITSANTGAFANTSAIDLHLMLYNPYKGLQPFERSDADNFFGRDGLIEAVITKLREDGPYQRFLAVVGASGSGKSSLIKAGVLPAIRAGDLDYLGSMQVTEITPGAQPLRRLEGVILSAAHRIDEELFRRLGKDDYILSEALERCMPSDGSELILFIDQFEEVFTLVEDEEHRNRFLDLLAEAVTAPKSRLRLIITMRGDYLEKIAYHPIFARLIESRLQLIGPMDEEELTDAIVEPATQASLSVDLRLVSAMVSEVKDLPGALPLMQQALYQMTQQLIEERRGFELTLDDYDAIGRVAGSVASSARVLYEQLDTHRRNLLRQIFLRLVQPSDTGRDTRRRALMAEIFALDPDRQSIQELLDRFGKRRLLTFASDPVTRAPTVEVAHEALLDSWETLRKWIDDNREQIKIRTRLSTRTAEWLQSRRSDKDRSRASDQYLATGAELKQFEELSEKGTLTLNEDERAFITRSVNRRERANRIKNAVIVAMVISLFAISGLLAVAVEQRRQTEIARDEAAANAVQSRSRELAASALKEIAQPDRALLLAREAVEVQDTYEARSSLLTVLQSQPNLEAFLHGHSDNIRAVTYHPDGTLLASASRDNSVRLWDSQTYELLAVLEGHSGWVSSLDFSPDGALLASGSQDGTVRLWNVAEQREISLIEAHDGEVRALDFDLTGERIVSGGLDGRVRIWDSGTGEEQFDLGGASDEIYALSFTPDGGRVIAGGNDGVIHIWDTSSGEELATLEGHTNWVQSLAVHPDGVILASGSADRTIRLWSLDAYRQLGQPLLLHSAIVRVLRFTPDGERLVSGGDDGLINLAELASGDIVTRRSVGLAPVWDIAISSDESHYVLATATPALTVWQMQVAAPLSTELPPQEQEVLQVAFSPDGELMATAGGRDDEGTAIQLRDISGEIIRLLEGHEAPVGGLSFSPDGNRLASASRDGLVRVWDVISGNVLAEEQFSSGAFTLAYNPTSDQLAIGDNAGLVWRWSVMGEPETWAILPSISAHTARVQALVYSPDGARLVSGGLDGSILIWDSASGERIAGPVDAHVDGVLALAYRPDGGLLASGGRDTLIRRWDAELNPVGDPFTAHTNWVMDLSYHPDGRMLASASSDSSIILWDMQAARPLGQPLLGHRSWVNALDFSPSGRALLSGGRGGRVLLWRTGLDEWEVTACTIAGRSFTAEELQSYFADEPVPADCDAAPTTVELS